jgi:hypothetical protein
MFLIWNAIPSFIKKLVAFLAIYFKTFNNGTTSLQGKKCMQC